MLKIQSELQVTFHRVVRRDDELLLEVLCGSHDLYLIFDANTLAYESGMYDAGSDADACLVCGCYHVSKVADAECGVEGAFENAWAEEIESISAALPKWLRDNTPQAM